MTLIASLLLAAAQAAAPAPRGDQETVQTNSDPSWKVTIPKGYLPVAPRDAGYSYERPAGREAWERIRIDLVPLGRALVLKEAPPVDELVRAVTFAGARDVKPVKMTWEDLPIDGVECRWSLEGIDQAARIAWVPTWPQATAVCVSAPTTLARELVPELSHLLLSFKGRTRWLTEGEQRALRTWRWPGFVVPALSGLFLVTWALLFRGRPMIAHALRLAWHVSVPAAAAAAFYFLERSSAAREKMGIEAPLLLWFVVIGPLALFHLVMIAHRVRTAVDVGD